MKTIKRGRDARSGQFIPVREAERRSSTTTIKRVPKPAHGDRGISGKSQAVIEQTERRFGRLLDNLAKR